MKPQAKQIANYPDIGAKLEEHIPESEGKIGRIGDILTSLAVPREGPGAFFYGIDGSIWPFDCG